MMKASFVGLFALSVLASAAQAQDTTRTAADTGYIEYRESPISLPLVFGLRIPSYDRVNGLTLPWGPQLSLAGEKLQLDALVSYRSNLGKWDPSLEGFARPGDNNEISIEVGRGTFTNDSWIRSDLVNSAAAFFVGSDSRNYYRADRVTGRFTRTLTRSSLTLTPFIGGNFERDWSTGSLAPQKSPWSFFGRKGKLKMRRPNPEIVKGRIGSLLAGSGLEFIGQGLQAKMTATVEYAPSEDGGPVVCAAGSPPIFSGCFPIIPNFTQTTIESSAQFPTFGSQTFEFRGHLVLPGGNGAPPQRFAYLGGAGTLATVDLLALGGDHLLYVEGVYKIPIDLVQLPLLGPPFVALRYAAGNAAFGSLPALIQNLGVGLGFGFLRADYSIDPAGNRSPFSRRSAFSVGVSLSP